MTAGELVEKLRQVPNDTIIDSDLLKCIEYGVPIQFKDDIHEIVKEIEELNNRAIR